MNEDNFTLAKTPAVIYCGFNVMNTSRVLLGGFVGAIFAAAGLFAAETGSTNATVATPPVYVPDTAQVNTPMPDGVFAWASLMQKTNVPDGTEQVHFIFSFTNVAKAVDGTLVTNIADVAEGTAITNSISPVPVTIFGVHPSCSCTVPELPSLPWTIQPGGSGEFGATVDVQGRTGTQMKYVTVSTDKGYKDLWMEITIDPPVVLVLSDADRARDLEIAKADRQAVFKPDCATCHAKKTDGKYGKMLYDAVCAICHDADKRSPLVPDLRAVKTATNADFWRVWIANGKPGSLMPAFSTTAGGPLDDTQIGTLAAYLNTTYPSKVPPPQ